MACADRTALVARVRRRLVDQGRPPEPAAVAAALREEGAVLGDAEVLAVLTALRAESSGAGPLDPLLADEQVTDVLVNGPGEVWLDRGGGLVRAAVRFPDEAAVRRLAQRLAAAAGRRLDEARPWADVRLPDGSRLHAVLPPVARGGTCLSLRLFRRRAFALDDLLGAGTGREQLAGLLHCLVQARLAFLVTGGTGAGKTTLLAALLGLVDPAERLLLVEDSGELRPDHPHVVRLECRSANVEGAGEVTLRDLVRQALRMRPDRLVVGEVRGAEVVDLLAALNTGHEGGCGTVHANRPADLPARLEALASMGGLAPGALHSQLAAAVQVVVHVVRERGGRRRVGELGVLVREPDGGVLVRPAVETDEAGGVSRGPAYSSLLRLLEAGGAPPPALPG